VFSIGITPVNDAPVLAVNNGLIVAEGTATVVHSSTLQAVDADTTSDALTYTIITPPTNGTLDPAASFTQAQIDAGAVSYTHDGDDTSIDGFSFSVSDGNGGNIAAAVFGIIVTPVNDAPVLAGNNGLTLAEAAAAVIDNTLLQVVDADTASDTLTYTVITPPANGTLTPATSFTQAQIDANEVSYIHDGSETVGDSFSFSVSDGNGGDIAETPFTITVTPVNDAPELGLTALAPGTSGQPYSVNFTPSDPDLPGDQLTVKIVSGPAWLSTLVEEGDGSWTLSGTPSSSDVGTNAISLRVDDDGTPPLNHQVALTLGITGIVGVPTLSPVGTLALLALLGAAAQFALRRRRS
jgi:hypothetical protein